MAFKSSGVSLQTRNKVNIWRIGQSLANQKQSKMHSMDEVLCFFFYYKSREKKTIRDPATVAPCELMNLWEEVGVYQRDRKKTCNQ